MVCRKRGTSVPMLVPYLFLRNEAQVPDYLSATNIVRMIHSVDHGNFRKIEWAHACQTRDVDTD